MSTSQRNPDLWTLMRKLGFARLVLSAGMPRSGSTLIFNVLRLCLEKRYGDALASGWVGELRKLGTAPAYLLKVHEVSPLLRLRSQIIFYTYRDIRDVLVSSQKKFGASPSMGVCRQYIAEYDAARRYADCMLRYETFNADLAGTVGLIAKALGITVVPDEIVAALPSAKGSDRPGYDRKTLLHQSHATHTEAGSWRQVLSPELQSQIAREFAGWFAENGYPAG
jgi:hypothetical protein